MWNYYYYDYRLESYRTTLAWAQMHITNWSYYNGPLLNLIGALKNGKQIQDCYHKKQSEASGWRP